MLRKFFTLLIIYAFMGVGLAQSASAHCDDKGACNVLRRGHVRGRLPIACISIPYVKHRYGQVAMFVLDHFDPDASPEERQAILAGALFHDSKVTGPVDNFCRNRRYFEGAHWVVLCDEHHMGWITGESLRYAIRYGHPPQNTRVHIGSGL